MTNPLLLPLFYTLSDQNIEIWFLFSCFSYSSMSCQQTPRGKNFWMICSVTCRKEVGFFPFHLVSLKHKHDLYTIIFISIIQQTCPAFSNFMHTSFKENLISHSRKKIVRNFPEPCPSPLCNVAAINTLRIPLIEIKLKGRDEWNLGVVWNIHQLECFNVIVCFVKQI